MNNQEVELYSIGETAKRLKRSIETIRLWEKKQIIPKPLYRGKNNIRLYHPKEVEAMRKVLNKQGKKYARQETLKEAMWEALLEVRKELLNVKDKAHS